MNLREDKHLNFKNFVILKFQPIKIGILTSFFVYCQHLITFKTKML